MGCRVSLARAIALTHDHLLVMLQAALERVDERIDDHAHALRRDGEQRLEPAQVEGHVLLRRMRQLGVARRPAQAQSRRRLRSTDRRCHAPEMLPPPSLALAPDMRRCDVEPRRYVGCALAPCDWRRALPLAADERRSAPGSGLIVVIGSMARAQAGSSSSRSAVVSSATADVWAVRTVGRRRRSGEAQGCAGMDASAGRNRCREREVVGDERFRLGRSQIAPGKRSVRNAVQAHEMTRERGGDDASLAVLRARIVLE